MSACTTFDKSKIKNLNDGVVQKIGHGGSGFTSLIPFNSSPANSMASIKKALIENKADGVEVDVHMTADGKFVLYHDMELDSKTNLKGCIETLNYKEVVGKEYKVGFPYDIFQSEKIIGMIDLVDLCKELNQFPFLHFDLRNYSKCFTAEENNEWEIKFYHNFIKFLQEERVPSEKMLLISQRRTFLKFAKAQNCIYPLSLEEYGTFDEGLIWVKENGINYLTFKPEKLSVEKTALAHKEGVQIITFGGKSTSGNKTLLGLNPDYIQTNNLNTLQKLLR